MEKYSGIELTAMTRLTKALARSILQEEKLYIAADGWVTDNAGETIGVTFDNDHSAQRFIERLIEDGFPFQTNRDFKKPAANQAVVKF